MKTFIDIYKVGQTPAEVVTVDKSVDKYKVLNETTKGLWTYEIDKIENIGEGTIVSFINLYIPGRVMVGVGVSKSYNESIELAIEDAYKKLFILEEPSNNIKPTNAIKVLKEATEQIKETVIEEVKVEKIEVVEVKTEDIVDINNVLTFDEIEDETVPTKFDEQKHLQELKEKEERDNSTPIPGSDITQRQIDFMNDFKEHNKIDTEEKFDYYIKTWATHNSIDDITTKKELINAGRDVLEDFINWIKKFQPILDKGIVSPI